jgi:hypothetical protein
MVRRMTRRSAVRLVLSLAILLPGCTGLIGGKDTIPFPAERQAERGSFQVLKGRAGVVIGAPHGTSDRATEDISRDLARLTGFSLVVATGFAHLDAEGRRFNVNRRTESVPGTPAGLEGETAEARRVFEVYRRHVDAAAQGPLLLYVEVHGNAGTDSAGRVEIATVGLSRDDAWRLKTLFELIRDACIGAAADVPRLDVWIGSPDPLRYTAWAAKQSGMLAASGRALHIELPLVARTSSREVYTGLLGEFLIQSAAFLMPRGH